MNKEIAFKTVAATLLVLAICGYSVYQFKDFWRGPTVKITSPQDGLQTNSQLITVSGTAKQIAFLYLNDEKIYTNQAGQFSEPLLLDQGYNIISVRAEDRFDRTVKKTVRVQFVGEITNKSADSSPATTTKATTSTTTNSR